MEIWNTWVVKFEVQKIFNKDSKSINEYDKYSCNAFISLDNEFNQQSQIINIDNISLISERKNSEDNNKTISDCQSQWL